jgi:hypothetical protein
MNDFLFMAGSASGYESGKIGRWDNVIMSGVTGYGGLQRPQIAGRLQASLSCFAGNKNLILL